MPLLKCHGGIEFGKNRASSSVLGYCYIRELDAHMKTSFPVLTC